MIWWIAVISYFAVWCSFYPPLLRTAYADDRAHNIWGHTPRESQIRASWIGMLQAFGWPVFGIIYVGKRILDTDERRLEEEKQKALTLVNARRIVAAHEEEQRRESARELRHFQNQLEG